MFELGFLTSAEPGQPSLVVRVRGDTVAIEEGPLPDRAHFLGALDGRPCVATEEPEAPDGRVSSACANCGDRSTHRSGPSPAGPSR